MLRRQSGLQVGGRDELGINDYRRRIEAVVGEYAPIAKQWEASGHLDRELFVDLGRAGAFRDRWSSGAKEGLPYAVALLETMAPLPGGASLAVSIHSEVFLASLSLSRHHRNSSTWNAALDGKAIGCVAITEDQGGSDIQGITTVATRIERGWRLQGRKKYITNAGRSTHALILGKTGESRGWTLFLVPLESPGVTITRFSRKAGMWSSDSSELIIDTHLDADSTVGPIGGGLAVLNRVLTFERIAISVLLVSGARHALRLSTAYLRHRYQFGARLYDHQALRHRLVDSWTELAAAEALTEKVVSRVLAGLARPHEAAHLKLFCATTCTRIADECVQFFGGRGYHGPFPIERMWRDARLARIGAGTDEVMRELLGLEYDSADPEAERLITALEVVDAPEGDFEDAPMA